MNRSLLRMFLKNRSVVPHTIFLPFLKKGKKKKRSLTKALWTLSGISFSLSSSFHLSLSIPFLEINWDHMIVVTRANFMLFENCLRESLDWMDLSRRREQMKEQWYHVVRNICAFLFLCLTFQVGNWFCLTSRTSKRKVCNLKGQKAGKQTFSEIISYLFMACVYFS